VRSDVLPDGPRLRFLRALVSAAEEGLDPDDPAWTDPAGRPPAFSESGGDGRRDPAAEAWLAALDAERRGAPSDALRARAALLDERLVPAGLLRTLLWGERPPRAIADETLALARRLAAFGARLGLRPLRVDVADAAARSAAAAGDAERADERFRAALALDPANTDARYAYVRWLQKVGRQEEADIETNRLLEIDPDSARARELAGLRALVAGRTDEALAHLERARTLDPVAPWTLYALGRAYLERQRFAEAEVALRTARMLAAASFPDVDELHARAVAALGR
ncbi:MAG: tetratricopeptide repeat protein, partial [Planctomycetota bacterium JB042]